ncbi:hypothetical protein KIL84_014794 [Mauremys mutica]|uniref:Uncharacterized protein n=1 Tax=Mauremys mutica TaxID=74926 RepID=A0A9D3XRQ3_9SAUR|nr:hypothetical protein KIL84_014794 [Mauremys mutica]
MIRKSLPLPLPTAQEEHLEPKLRACPHGVTLPDQEPGTTRRELGQGELRVRTNHYALGSGATRRRRRLRAAPCPAGPGDARLRLAPALSGRGGARRFRGGTDSGRARGSGPQAR